MHPCDVKPQVTEPRQEEKCASNARLIILGRIFENPIFFLSLRKRVANRWLRFIVRITLSTFMNAIPVILNRPSWIPRVGRCLMV